MQHLSRVVKVSLLLHLLSTPATAFGAILRVDYEAVGSDDGSSWADAYTSLSVAIANAAFGDELWVAAGTYSPRPNLGDHFQLPAGVAIYGGFSGVTPAPGGLPSGETMRDQRSPDPATNGCVLDGAQTNSYVVRAELGATFENTILDGFRRRRGRLWSAPLQQVGTR